MLQASKTDPETPKTTKKSSMLNILWAAQVGLLLEGSRIGLEGVVGILKDVPGNLYVYLYIYIYDPNNENHIEIQMEHGMEATMLAGLIRDSARSAQTGSHTQQLFRASKTSCVAEIYPYTLPPKSQSLKPNHEVFSAPGQPKPGT